MNETPQKTPSRSKAFLFLLPAFLLFLALIFLITRQTAPPSPKESTASLLVQTKAPSSVEDAYVPPDDELDILLGQKEPNDAIPNGLDAKSLAQPCWVAVDNSVTPYRLYVVDSQNFRILGYKNPLAKPPVEADLVLCQPSFNKATFYEETTGPDQVYAMRAITVDATGNLFLTDTEHHRVLEYDQPFETDTKCDRVYGQPDFYSMKPDFGTNVLAYPKGVCSDPKTGTLWVADGGNNRVLAYFSPLSDATADFVIGQQGDFESRAANYGGLNAGSLYAPVSVWVQGDDLVVSDLGNNRVLYYSDPLHTDATADYVFGQDGQFDKSEAGCSPFRIKAPEAAIIDASGQVLISDARNNRALLFEKPGSFRIQPIGLWGQWQSLHTSEPNFRGLGPASFEDPMATAISPDNILWVADCANNRVLGFDGGTMGDKDADHVIGQIDMFHSAINFLDNYCLYFPRDLAIDKRANPNRLYVADFENCRVLGYKSVKDLEKDTGANIVLGQPDFYSHLPGEGKDHFNLCPSVAVDPRNSGVYVADRENNRVLFFEDPFVTDTTADFVIGQVDFNKFDPNACGGDVVSATGLNRLEGITVDSEGNLYVADSRNHRVLRFDRPTETDMVADAVWGQLGSFTAGTKNAGKDGVNPDGFAFPFKLAISEKGFLAVADVENHRILIFDLKSMNPYVPIKVLGQNGSFTTNGDHTGGVSARCFSGPEGVLFRGDSLFISDTADNRVLFFRNFLAGGDEAEKVYGQLGSFTTNYIGVGRVSTRNLWLPSGIDMDTDGNLYVADREESRVTIYKAGQ